MLKRTVFFFLCLSVLPAFAAGHAKTDYRCSNPDVLASTKKLYLEKYSPVALLAQNQTPEAKKAVEDYSRDMALIEIRTTKKGGFGYDCKASVQSPAMKFEIDGGPFEAPAMKLEFAYNVAFTDDGKFVVSAIGD